MMEEGRELGVERGGEGVRVVVHEVGLASG